MEQGAGHKDFSSISQSARWMVMLKGYTNIPYAREAAELLEYPGKFIPDFNKRELSLWAPAYHLETRYKSIENLLKDLTISNILELSSGFSFRSLDHARKQGVYYIDTDLPDIIAQKREFVKSLLRNINDIKGKLELLPLNVLDEKSFLEITGHFPAGGVAIVNEGLFTYLDRTEQKKLCTVIHSILKERGGCWINADIYLRNRQPQMGLQYNDKVKRFYEQHDTEINSFESFGEAEIFFREMGFEVGKEARVKMSELSSMKYLIRSITLRQLIKYKKIGKLQATWLLKAI
jgi:O-methyltransferase involved in polyketide biosynthesis